MKTLKDYLKECISGVFATPANTIGIGNPVAPDASGIGSGDILVPLEKDPKIPLKPIKKDKKKKKKQIKNEEF